MTNDPLSIGSARPDERVAAFALLFPTDENVLERVERAEQMIECGQLDPAALRVARDKAGLAAAILAAPLPGGGAVVWPPRQRSHFGKSTVVVESLCRDTVDWLQQQGTRLAQALVSSSEAELVKPLLQFGFRHTTPLDYLRHFLGLSLQQIRAEEKCDYQTYEQAGESAFVDVLQRTYEGTLDCPEINDARTPADVLEGHRAAGPFDPERWWLALLDGKPAGMVLATTPEPNAWDIAYLGVVPEMRRRGIGAELIRKALFEAKIAEVPMVTLAVDERNAPARSLYRAAGFEEYDDRDVYLRRFN